MTDKDLVRLYQTGDDNALAILISRHKERIFSTIYYLVRHRELAEDLFQDTFVKIISNLKEKKYNEEGKFLPWAVRVAHNLVIDHFRVGSNAKMKMVRETELYNPFNVMPERSKNALEELIDNEKAAYVRGFVERLPDHQREVVILRHYGGLSFKEISEALQINMNTCLGRMHYAVIEMRRMMTGEVETKEIDKKKKKKKKI